MSAVNGIYVASKTVHAPRWLELRSAGAPIISTWIDEAGSGATSDWADLWTRCVREAATASALIAYSEPGEQLKGGLVEIGAALAAGVPVFWVGPIAGQISTHHPGVHVVASLEEAFALATPAGRPALAGQS